MKKACKLNFIWCQLRLPDAWKIIFISFKSSLASQLLCVCLIDSAILLGYQSEKSSQATGKKFDVAHARHNKNLYFYYKFDVIENERYCLPQKKKKKYWWPRWDYDLLLRKK